MRVVREMLKDKALFSSFKIFSILAYENKKRAGTIS